MPSVETDVSIERIEVVPIAQTRRLLRFASLTISTASSGMMKYESFRVNLRDYDFTLLKDEEE